MLSAEYLYLQDIGNGVATEYEFEEDFSKFLYEHQEYLDMERGHIHSHNRMGVFFSSTDDQELIDNSKNYNFYLSLIVNNNNDMLAKVAFRVHKKSTISSVLEFNDSNGNKTSQSITEQAEQVHVSFYPCKIIKPALIDDILATCFTNIKEKKSKAGTVGSVTGSQASIKSGHGKQSTFWGPDDLTNVQPTKKSKKKKAARNSFKKGVIREPQLDRTAYSFLVKLLNLDYLSEATLTQTILSLAQRQTQKTGFYHHIDEIANRVIDFYLNSYPEDIKLEGIYDVITSAKGALERGYENSHPELISILLEIFNFELQL